MASVSPACGLFESLLLRFGVFRRLLLACRRATRLAQPPATSSDHPDVNPYGKVVMHGPILHGIGTAAAKKSAISRLPALPARFAALHWGCIAVGVCVAGEDEEMSYFLGSPLV